MRALRVRSLYVIDGQDPFDMPLAAIVAEDARRAGIEVKGEDGIDTTTAGEFGEEVRKVSASAAQAVFFSGAPNAGAVALQRELHAADPGLRLLGSSALAQDSFAARLGPAGARMYLTTPMLPVGLYPPAAQPVLREYRRRFGEAPGPGALYGYEAMSAVLQAIRRAGSHGNDRRDVIRRFFAIGVRDSVLGRYSVRGDGDTTLSRYGVDRIVGGRLVFWRAFAAG
jgi:branched-chain amino acid transport system substrate-binding protein